MRPTYKLYEHLYRWTRGRRFRFRLGSRNLSDFSVTDVLVELSDPGPLLVGMKVDVYFQNEVATQ